MTFDNGTEGWQGPGFIEATGGNPGRHFHVIVPDTFAWPLEGEPIYNVYPEFNNWIDWINDQNLPEPSPPWWQFDPVDGSQFFNRELFL